MKLTTVSKFTLAGAVAMTGLALGIGAGQPLSAQPSDAASFYKGNTARIIVGYGPGGGYDTYARMIAPELEKRTGATWVVENQPGAGGIAALNRLYAASPQEGLQIMIVNGTGAALGQILDQSAASYDLTKMGHLGIVTSSPWIWIATPQAAFSTIPEAMEPNRKLNWAASGVTDGLGDGAAITCAALNLDCQIVRGYSGSRGAALAVMQGEMDSLYVSDSSANRYVQSQGAKPIGAMSRERSRFFPDLKTVFEQVDLNDEQVWWFDFRATLDDLGRMLVTQPNIPADRLAFLQNAVGEVLTDTDFVAEAERIKRYIAYQDSETTRQKVLQVVSSLTPEQKKRVQEVILPK